MITEKQRARFLGKVLGQPCTIEYLNIDDLKMDMCQRILDEDHVYNMLRKSNGLDLFKFKPIDVIRTSTGELKVIDGQHRIESHLWVIPEQRKIQCRVIETDDAALAAKLFADFNAKGIKKVKDTDLLWAEIIAEEPQALKTLENLKFCNLHCNRVNQTNDPDQRSVDLAAFRKCVKWGLAETKRAVDLYKKAWPAERSINGDVLPGMVRLLTFDHYRNDLALTTQYGQEFDQWFVNVFQHLSINRAKYAEYRNAQSGNWYDGVAWGLLEDFATSQLAKMKGHPNKRKLEQLHGNTRLAR